jgi:hypothetical protein
MLEIQKFLLTSESKDKAIAELKDVYGIDAGFHPQYPNLVQFTYDQIKSLDHKADAIVREARGLILDSGDWSIVAYPFRRFFNYGEAEADELDWNSVRVQEKIDGSLMILYHYDNQWHVATKGSLTASGGNEKSFKSLFWGCNPDISWCVPGFTYVFELTSRYNRVVTSQLDNEGTLTLIMVRDQNQNEIPVSEFVWYFRVVREFPMQTIEQIQEAAKSLNPLEQEGYVALDRNFNRVKIKSPRYVQIHRVKDSLNVRRCIELIQQGEESEVIAYFPDLAQRYD